FFGCAADDTCVVTQSLRRERGAIEQRLDMGRFSRKRQIVVPSEHPDHDADVTFVIVERGGDGTYAGYAQPRDGSVTVCADFSIEFSQLGRRELPPGNRKRVLLKPGGLLHTLLGQMGCE